MQKKSFRTVEISDSHFAADGLRYITIKSAYLKGRGDICVFVPQDIEHLQDVPVFILLHGVYGSAWSWSGSGGVHRTAHSLMQEKMIPPAVIAMPSDGLWGDGSGYLPHDGYDFKKWIQEDVPAALKTCLPFVSDLSPICIGGLSMGGFGAFITGIDNERCRAISAHSSITNVRQMEKFVEEPLSHYLQSDSSLHDVGDLILSHRDNLPALRFDCGKDDPLIEGNRELQQRLISEGVKHIYEENAGGHTWEYWQREVKKSLLFFADTLKDSTQSASQYAG